MCAANEHGVFKKSTQKESTSFFDSGDWKQWLWERKVQQRMEKKLRGSSLLAAKDIYSMRCRLWAIHHRPLDSLLGGRVMSHPRKPHLFSDGAWDAFLGLAPLEAPMETTSPQGEHELMDMLRFVTSTQSTQW